MKLALIASHHTADGRGIGIATEEDHLLDVAAAVHHCRWQGAPNPGVTTIKELVEAGPSTLETLAELRAWLRERPRDELLASGVLQPLAKATLFPPIPDPGKFLCVGKNYRAHLDELVRADLIREIPDEPAGFIKLNSVLSAHEGEVARPRGIVQFDYEPELAFVIGRPGHRIRREEAMAHVFGFTLFNDLTAREIQRREVRVGTRFWTAKNMPGFGPMGPFILTADEVSDPHNLTIECWVNGERRSQFNTGGMIHRIDRIIEHYSEYLPLAAGDLFATGSAAGVAAGQSNAEELFLKPGDVVEVRLAEVMTLRTFIVDDPH
jgi:acylpyruvate hydrolase